MAEGTDTAAGPTALFIAGYRRAARAQAQVDDRLPALAALGEALLASGAGWRIRRLAPASGDRNEPTRRNVRREIDALLAGAGSVRLLVVLGELVRTVEGLGIVCAPELGGFLEDSTVSLEWLGDRLRRAPGQPTRVVLAGEGEASAPAHWLELIASAAPGHLLVAAADAPDRVLAALRTAVAGEPPTLDHLGERLACELPSAAIRRGAGGALPRPATANPAPAPSAPADPVIGSLLPGRFRIESEVGRGRFGTVYRARHELIDRLVAVKVMRAAVTPVVARQFLDEIQLVAKLDHPNIVKVMHADITPDGRMFVAMALLAGRSLHAVLQAEGTLPIPRALAITRDLCAALSAAHAGGAIHADVNPDNIMVLDADDRAVLVDFGLARLWSAAPAISRGGTPAFMAPEQLRAGQVEPRSDLYAAALVLLRMVAGSIHQIADAGLRAILQRALAEEPAERFDSVQAFDEALRAYESIELAGRVRAPFRIAAPFTEAERRDFHGRERELEALVEHVLFRRVVVYAAPSGTGKTSLLRAGLLPRLTKLGLRTLYVPCRAGAPHGLAEAIAPHSADVASAIERHQASGAPRLVIVIDQLEANLVRAASHPHESVLDALQLTRWPLDAAVCVIFSVREEYATRLLAQVQHLEPALPVVRLGPLGVDVAREVLVKTLDARGIGAEPALLDVLLADLARAAERLAVEHGWDERAVVYPPHLQLVGTVLFDALPAGASQLTVALYRELGGFSAIIAEHLHRVLEASLDAEATAIARDLLLALMTSHGSMARTEAELVAVVRHPVEAVSRVLTFLRDRGLLVMTGGPAGDQRWELAHDSLVERIQDWITSTDLARLRALELVRYHLRRSGRAQSLLDRDELREIRAHLGASDVRLLDEEWARSDGREAPATELIAASHRTLRRRRLAAAGLAVTAVIVAVVLGGQYLRERELRQHEATSRDRDLGESAIDVRLVDWDPVAAVWRPSTAIAAIEWEWFKPSVTDEDAPGEPFPREDLERRRLPAPDPTTATEILTARGGPAVLVVHRRGCTDAIIPVRQLPGYSQRGRATRFAVQVPTCAATRAGMVEIPAGPFIAGGPGEPAAPYPPTRLAPETEVHLPRFWIDRTEITLAAFRGFIAMSAIHGFVEQPAPDGLTARDAAMPASAMTWREARAFCRYLGKDLPTLDQWDKTLRGGVMLGAAPNPCPRRNYAWCGDLRPGDANLPHGDESGPKPVATHGRDTSPYGVADLVGNVHEWTRSPALPYESLSPAELITRRFERQTSTRPLVITRGCNWGDVECEASPLLMMPIPNPRLRDVRYYTLGARCVLES